MGDLSFLKTEGLQLIVNLVKYIRAIETWYIVKMSNVGGVLVGFTCWGHPGWKIMSVIHSTYLCAFTNNHTILYNKHV